MLSTRRPPAVLAAACLAAALALLATACASSPATDAGGEAAAGEGRGAGRKVQRTFTMRLSFPDGAERVEVGEGETVRLERADAIYEFVPRLSNDKRGQMELTARRIHLDRTEQGVLVKPMNDPSGIDFSTTGIDLSQELGGNWPSVGVKVLSVRPPVMPGSWMPSGG